MLFVRLFSDFRRQPVDEMEACDLDRLAILRDAKLILDEIADRAAALIPGRDFQ